TANLIIEGPVRYVKLATAILPPLEQGLYISSLLADQQNKSPGTDQQGKPNTDDDRKPLTLTSCRFDCFGPSGFLRCSYTEPEEKIAHRPINLARNLAKSCTSNPCRKARCCGLGLKHVPGFPLQRTKLTKGVSHR